MSITDSTAMPRLGRRRREAHPERIAVGDATFERNDIIAAKYGITERTLNRDRKSVV